MWAVFLFEKLGTDSVNYADSGDIKILVWFPGSSILKFSIIFWKCVGGAQMRGCFILKITENINLITLVIFVYKMRGTYSISSQPTQFSIFGRFFIRNPFSSAALCDDIYIKRCGILLRIFWYIWKVCRGMPTYPNAYAKVKKWIFDVRFPGKCFEFGIILNDFRNSTIWAIQIQVS